jgi:flagellar hook-associated protein 3 FlgL
MNIGSLGDLAQTYVSQSRTTALKNDIQRLTLELSSGQVSDIRTAVGGNTEYVNDLDRSLIKLDGYDLAVTEAAQFAEGVQTILTQIGDLTTSFRDTLLTATNSALGETSDSILFQAKETFSSVVNAMNTRVGGRTLLAGTSTDTQPIAVADDILAAVTMAVAGAGNVDDIIAAADVWFNDPTGYDSVAYLGSDTSLAPMSLSDRDSAVFDLRGDDQMFRDTLRNLAIVAIADDPTLTLTAAQQSELFQKTTDSVSNAHDAMIGVQSRVGFSESQIETIKVRHGAERSSLEIARNDLFSVDPYQAATELEQVQFQLQSLFAIMSRMSQLSLANYL